MTTQVNLIPADYLRRTRRARRVKVWIGLCVGMVALHALAAMAVRFKGRVTGQILAETVRMQTEQQELIRQCARLTAEKRSLARGVALNEKLGQKHRWSEALAQLAANLPQSAVLTMLESDPPHADKTGMRNRPTEKTQRQGQDAKTPPNQDAAVRGFVVGGIATDHESVAQFLRALNDTSWFGNCQLQSTSRQPFMGDHGVAFTIWTRW